MNDPCAPIDTRSAASDRFVALFADAPIGIALLDATGGIVSANPALGTLLGIAPDALADTKFTNYVTSKPDAVALDALLASYSGAEPDAPTRFETALKQAEGDDARAKLTLSSLPADQEGMTYPVVMVEDVTDLNLLHERLRHQNVHDALTGLPNATSFHGQLESAMVDTTHATVALVLFDIDGFRMINDGLGSEAGDKILKGIATTLRHAFTGADEIVARLTGDGFGVLLKGDLTPQHVIDRVEDALDRLAEPIYFDDTGVGISASAGIVLRAPGSTSDTDMLRAAEVTLHRAKEAGRAKWMLFETDLDTEDRRRYRLGAGIAGGLERGEFEVRYQPMVKLDGSQLVPVVNTRLYWNHPTEGVLDCDDFLPLADATGMTVRIGTWMFDQALKDYAQWRKQAGEHTPDLCVLPPRRLAIDDDLVGIVRSQLTKHDIPSTALRLCADSGTLVDTRGEVHDSLSVLNDLGVKLVLAVSAAADLELIRRNGLPVEYVSLNGQIVDAMLGASEPGATQVEHLEHLVRSAKQLGVRIGAAGVHTEEQATALAGMGVVAARGRFFRGPLPAEEMGELIATE
ncbi:EAL domain-containing protein [Haloechinothrix halophila]|uniref:EAL domain-containing protein n=1 Tax=Haloechinothrix halophila TaxID=1069073 RepID=UPI00042448C8|nr:EAL domain-containing protein [Haloechinothrix halophila]